MFALASPPIEQVLPGLEAVPEPVPEQLVLKLELQPEPEPEAQTRTADAALGSQFHGTGLPSAAQTRPRRPTLRQQSCSTGEYPG